MQEFFLILRIIAAGNNVDESRACRSEIDVKQTKMFHRAEGNCRIGYVCMRFGFIYECDTFIYECRNSTKCQPTHPLSLAT